MKTHSGAKKRFRLKPGGKIKRKKKGLRHILSNKSSKRKRKLGMMDHVHASRGTVARSRRKKVLERASGYYSAGSRLFTVAKERNDRALVYAYRDRKAKKREFRKLWTIRINAAARLNGTTYSVLIGALKKAGIELDRKVLSDLAIHYPAAFSAVVKQAGL